ncbi:MAG: DUF5134 domain-containing protein [Novosphingobium sp.]|nr:DUF5134 domain-containing protein [Novosphingobium sp.]
MTAPMSALPISTPTAIFALACSVSLIRLVLVNRRGRAASPLVDSREADAAHVVMNGAMAVMPFAALHVWSGTALWLLAAALGLRLAYVAAARPKSAPGKQATLTGTAYHLLTVLAMIYAMQHMGPAAMDHAAMGHAGAHGGLSLALPGWITAALGGLFLIDGLLTLGAGLFAPSVVARAIREAGKPSGNVTGDLPEISRTSFLFAAFGHIVMDFGMAWMLLLSDRAGH